MKSATHTSAKKRNVSGNSDDRTIKGTIKKTTKTSAPPDNGNIGADQLFLHFTANIIKEDTLFTR